MDVIVFVCLRLFDAVLGLVYGVQKTFKRSARVVEQGFQCIDAFAAVVTDIIAFSFYIIVYDRLSGRIREAMSMSTAARSCSTKKKLEASAWVFQATTPVS
mgnify:CR=1 FL=1